MFFNIYLNEIGDVSTGMDPNTSLGSSWTSRFLRFAPEWWLNVQIYRQSDSESQLQRRQRSGSGLVPPIRDANSTDCFLWRRRSIFLKFELSLGKPLTTNVQTLIANEKSGAQITFIHGGGLSIPIVEEKFLSQNALRFFLTISVSNAKFCLLLERKS